MLLPWFSVFVFSGCHLFKPFHACLSKGRMVILRGILSFLLLGCSLLSAELSLEDKVGQLFFGFVYASSLDEETYGVIQRTHLGNVIYYNWANALSSPQQVRLLSQQ